MSQSIEIADIAEDYIREIENKGLEVLYKLASEAAHHAEKCNCCICRNAAQSAADAFMFERERLKPSINHRHST